MGGGDHGRSAGPVVTRTIYGVTIPQGIISL